MADPLELFAALLIIKGDVLLAKNKPDAARAAYARPAQEGNARAATGMSRTYPAGSPMALAWEQWATELRKKGE